VHPSVYAFATTALGPAEIGGARVLEAGAYNYNGSVRGYFEALNPASYCGTDAQPGPGVDVTCPAERLPELLGHGWDIVVSTEMLEHALDWRGAVRGMTVALAPGGFLLLTTRSNGFPYHPHPEDHWRFSLDQMDGVAEACGLKVAHLERDDPVTPGVFLLAVKPDDWDPAGMTEGLAVIEPGPPR
jgi:hypothetical protein